MGIALEPTRHRQRTGGRVIRLDRPDEGNPIDLAMLLRLGQALESPLPEPLLLSASGRHFSIGWDLDEIAEFDAKAAANYSLAGQAVCRRLEAWPAPTLAWIDGIACGVGLELALHCDIIVCSAQALLSLPGLALGLMPAFNSLIPLADRSPNLARRLFLAGEVLDAKTSLHEHLVDRILSSEAACEAFLDRLAGWPAGAVAAVRGLRLQRYAPRDPNLAARLFAAPFARRAPQRRVQRLLE